MAPFDPPSKSGPRLSTRTASPVPGQAQPQSRFRWDLHPLASASIVVVLVLLALAGVLRSVAAHPSTANSGAERGGLSANTSETDQEGVSATSSSAQSGRAAELPEMVVGGDLGNGSGEVLVVFVTGAVREPGVVSVPAGSRAEAAVLAAGGLVKEADMTSVNLASPLTDGEHIHVAAEGEAPLPMGLGSTSGSGPGTAASPGESAGCVNLNQASAEQLQVLDGVGPKIAARIVERRDALGGFSSNEDLLSVSGIGQVLYARISEGLCP